MFIAIGVNQKQEEFDFAQVLSCEVCGELGRINVYVVYMVFSFFFIPLFKWNRHYYARMSCCQSVYELAEQAGRRIENGEQVIIHSEDLTLLNEGNKSGYKKCSNCGYETTEDFAYCPKCGQRL